MVVLLGEKRGWKSSRRSSESGSDFNIHMNEKCTLTERWLNVTEMPIVSSLGVFNFPYLLLKGKIHFSCGFPINFDGNCSQLKQ